MSRQPRNYKSYFKNSLDTPTGIPRSTRYRQLKRTRLTFDEVSEPSITHDSVVSPYDDQYEPDIQSSYDDDLDLDTHSASSSDNDSETDISESLETGSIPALLFANSKITKKESLLLIYSFLIRHRLSNEATKDLLTLINFHLPSSVGIPTSVFLLDRALEPDYSTAKKTFYCPNCEEKVDAEKSLCESCNQSFTKSTLQKDGNFFMTLDIRSSLVSLLKVRDVRISLVETFQNRIKPTSTISDITDGSCYKMLNLGYCDLSCCINTDGVSLFNSSNLSIWPILLSVNELKYSLRRKHTLLAGLWFGSGKPCFDTFLSSLIQQCNDVGKNGISWIHLGTDYLSRVYFPMLAADSVARCTLQGINQFNGEYSCPWCLTRGESYTEEGSTRRWIFMPKNSEDRTKQNFTTHLRTLKKSLEEGGSETCFGIKTASQLHILTKFDIVNGFVFDYMHTCLLGIVRMITTRWFDSKFHTKSYYIGTKETEVSELFCRFTVPFECKRVTRPLKEMRYWKANEWKTWMLASVSILNNIQKSEYVKHFAKFVDVMILLNSRSITTQDLDCAEKLIKEFCSNAPNLYGKEICTFNMHLLVHVVECVKRWGPLWAYSLFQFEHVNGILVTSFSGTTQVGMQIVRRVLLRQQLCTTGQIDFVNDNAEHFFISMVDRRRLCANVVHCDSKTLFGSGRHYMFNERELKLLEKLDLAEITLGFSFKSCLLNGRKYSVAEKNSSKRTDSIVFIKGSLYVLAKIILVHHNDTVKTPIVLVKKITCLPISNCTKGSFKVVYVSDSVKVFFLSDIDNCKFICGYNAAGSLLYAIMLPNVIELE